MTNKLPSFGRIINTDYWALISVLLPAVVCVFYAAIVLLNVLPASRGWDPLLHENGATSWFWLSAISLLVGIPALIYRCTVIRGVFGTGIEANGTIVTATFYRDRGRVEYQFNLNGQAVRVAQGLHATPRTRLLHEGMDVTLIVDPTRPKRAFIKEIYLD